MASRAFRPINRILIAFDGGACAAKAVDHVARSPLFQGMECHLVMVGTDTTEARRKIDEAAARLSTSGMTVHSSVDAGAAEAAIAAKVEHHAIEVVPLSGTEWRLG